MSDGFQQNWTEFETAFARRKATSKRHHLALATEQMRGLMREVVVITPPGHEGLAGGTKEAMEHGQAKTAADVRAIYGTAGDAYDLLKQSGKGREDAFYSLYNHGDITRAAEILRVDTGAWFGPFDGGVQHRRLFVNGRVKRLRSRKVIYISDPKEVEDYVKQQQGCVMYLTAGWAEAFAKLGIPLQKFITKRKAPGSMLIEISEDRFRFLATDAVSYSAATDLQRRIQTAIDRQTGSMARQWEKYVDQLNKQAGL